MQLPQIRIQQQAAQIGLNIQSAQLTIEQAPAQQTIEQQQPEVHITTRPGRLTIDQSKALADVGIMPVKQSIQNWANNAMQAAISGSRQKQQEGDRLMKIEHGGSPLVDFAKQIGFSQQKQLAIDWIPSADGVEINYEPAEVHIEAEVRPPVIQAAATPTQFHYQRGGVETYLEQQNWLEIDIADLTFQGYQFELEI
ncbi:DUF6470 family protein [Gracilibacillus phocaeensis]|uniref:DUF6470 family protein n=1 Tax=Gracilibacillus phocaeensis TaxID=2042304 RepID=UPI0010303E20|nr:DUF6470 family protein [Gracilibacillus phocaeensis]